MGKRSHPNSGLVVMVAIGVTVFSCFMLKIHGHKVFDREIDQATISNLSGLNGKFEKGIFSIEIVRPKLNTEMDGVEVNSEFGLTGRMTLSGSQNNAVLLGDFPLREGEVNLLLRVVVQEGLSISSLHNRFIGDSERIMSLHFQGTGNQEVLSKAMGKVWRSLARVDLEKIVKRSPVKLSQSSLDQALMEKLLWKGKMKHGIFQVSLGRGTMLVQQELTASTGIQSWASFVGNEQDAVVNGEIASLENEALSVLKDLLNANIQITSIHPHLSEEKPRLVFIHFWGRGELEPLAAGVKEAFWEKEHFQSQ